MKKRFYPNSVRNECCVSRRIVESDAKYILAFNSPVDVRFDSAGFYETFIPCAHGTMCITCRSFDRLRDVVEYFYSLRHTSYRFSNSLNFFIHD